MACAPLEPITQRFIDDLMAAGGPPVYTLSPADARALLARQQSAPTAKPDPCRPLGGRWCVGGGRALRG